MRGDQTIGVERGSAAGKSPRTSGSVTPADHALNIREVRLCAGAEFVVLVCGDILTMPGLPVQPSSSAIDVDDDGRIVGLF